VSVLRRQWPGPEERPRVPIVAIGNFDGVHCGHQAILARVVARAREMGGTSVAVTFDPHPVTVLRPGASLGLLTTLDQKVELMAHLGVELVYALPFTAEFARRSAEQFVREDLIEQVGTREVYVGKNFAFGKGREGGVDDLRRLGARFGMTVVVQEPVAVGGALVSSSAIRQALREGRVDIAASLLGRAYAIDGLVAHGEGRGQALGYPTANLESGPQLLPKIGIYAARTDDLTTGERGMATAVYIGSQPTFGAHRLQVEAHLLDADVRRYGHRLRVGFVAWIRGEERFPDSGALVAQIARDVQAARTILSAPGSGVTA